MSKPKVIQFPVNNICNSRCQMCDIWQQKKEHEITPFELRKVISDPLFNEVMAVGMNGGEPTLRSDLADLARELCSGLPKLRSISLITNGLKPDLVIPRATELFAVTKKAGVKLDIMLSLDGVEDVHDRVRGRQGNFAAVEKCLSYFRANQIGDSHRLGCTLIAENIEDAERLMLWAEQQDVYCRFRVGIPHQRLYTKHKIEPFSLTAKQRFHLCNFLDTLVSRYEKDNPVRRLFLTNLRNQIAYAMPRANGCAWQDEGVTLLSDGGFAYCAVESPTLGNLVSGSVSPSSLYEQGQPLRDQILRTKCDECLHDYEGKSPRIMDRLMLRTQQVFREFNLPTKPISALKLSFNLAQNSAKLMPSRSISFSSAKKSLRGNAILIVGWYGTETLGDKAILYSILQELISCGVALERIVVASIEPYITEYTLKESDFASGCSVISLLEAESKAKIGKFSQVIFGGGPIMSSIGYLCDIASIFQSVHDRGGQAIVWGCGLGPIRKAKRDTLNKIAISKILKLADACVFRDQNSLEIAKKFAGSAINHYSNVALDPAFHWVASQARAQEMTAKVGFAIRDLPVAEYFSDSTSDLGSLSRDFNSAIIFLMRAHHQSTSVYLQCMHRLPCGGDDRLYYHDILGDEINQYDFSIEHKKPSEDVLALSGLNRLYAMRFHSVVFAVALGIPVVPIDYTNGGKISSLCHLLGIYCWSPSEFADRVLNHGEIPLPQCVDPELLKNLASTSMNTYKALAHKVMSFADS